MGAHRRARRAWTHGALAVAVTGALALALTQVGPANAATATPPAPPDHQANACPAGRTPSDGFGDTAGNPFAGQIQCIAAYGVTHGKTQDTYAPLEQVIRQQMAQFLYNLGSTSHRGTPVGGYPCQFSDIDQVRPTSERDAICADAENGITRGRTATTFAPAAVVTRDQMATFIVNTLRYEGIAITAPAGKDYFDDDNSDTAHQSDINALAAVGIVQGKSTGRYDPGSPVTRGEMAAYMARSLEYAIEQGAASSRYATGPGVVASGQVTDHTRSTFTQGGQTYTYDSDDLYSLYSDTAGNCADTIPYSEFGSRLSDGDSVDGTYQPSGSSTFCLHDTAPTPPASVTTAADTAHGGVQVTFADSPTPSVIGYRVYRATATPPPASGGTGYACPAYAATPGASPQTPPSSPYALVGFVADTSSNAATADSYTFGDPKAQGQANPLQADQYCYVVSSVDAGGQTGTGRAAAQNADGGVAGAPTPTGTAEPTFAGLTETSQATFVATYDGPIDLATCHADDFAASYTDALQTEHPLVIKTAVCDDQGTGGAGRVTVTFDHNVPSVPGNSVRLSAKQGGDGDTVCASGGTGCQPVGDTASASVSRTAPALVSASMTSATGLQLLYTEYVAGGTVQPADYRVTVGTGASATTATVTAAAATSDSSMFVNVTLQEPVGVGQQVAVTVVTPSPSDPDTVCTPNETGNCEASGDSTSTTWTGSTPSASTRR